MNAGTRRAVRLIFFLLTRLQGGFEATGKIREYERSLGSQRTPIIALTAHAMMGDRERCIQAQMDEYLSKPLQQNHLIQTILKCATLGGALSTNRDRDITRQVDAKAVGQRLPADITSQYLRPGRPSMQSHGSDIVRSGVDSPALASAEQEDPLSRARTSKSLSALPAGQKRKR